MNSSRARYVERPGQNQRRLAARHALDVGKARPHDARPHLLGLAGVVRREDDVRQLQQRVVGDGRLGIEHVQARAGQRARLQRREQRRLVDHRRRGWC